MIFANVSDIAIPEGNVIKIHETNSGRVLWEKKSIEINPYWNVISSYTNNGGAQPILVTTMPYDRNTYYLMGAASTWTGRTVWGRLSELQNYNIKNINNVNFYTAGLVYSTEYSSTYPRTVYAITKKVDSENQIGVVYFFDSYTNAYYFTRDVSSSFLRGDVFIKPDNGYSIKTIAQKSDYSVRITHSPERNEYLVTGLSSGRSCILPAGFTSSTSLTYQTGKPVSTFINTSWCPQFNSYYAASGADKKVYYSNDGISWNEVTVVDKGSVFDVIYLSKQGKLCAISNEQVSLSADGVTWSKFSVPFSDVYIAAYSDDTGYLAVLNNKKAFVTRDFINWAEATLPSNRNVNFLDFIHLGAGIFIATRKNMLSSTTTQAEFYELSIFPTSISGNHAINYLLDSSQ